MENELEFVDENFESEISDSHWKKKEDKIVEKLENNNLEYREVIDSIFKEGAVMKLDTSGIIPQMKDAIELIKKSIRKGGKIIICGNGGSATQSNHFAAELTGKFEKEGKAIPCLSLTSDTTPITAIANDYGFECIFSRQLEAFGKERDVLIAITTSDYNEENKHSLNIKYAIDKAKEKRIETVGLFSTKSDKIGDLVDVAIKVNGKNTARIQEMHISILHLFAYFLEKEFR